MRADEFLKSIKETEWRKAWGDIFGQPMSAETIRDLFFEKAFDRGLSIGTDHYKAKIRELEDECERLKRMNVYCIENPKSTIIAGLSVDQILLLKEYWLINNKRLPGAVTSDES